MMIKKIKITLPILFLFISINIFSQCGTFPTNINPYFNDDPSGQGVGVFKNGDYVGVSFSNNILNVDIDLGDEIFVFATCRFASVKSLNELAGPNTDVGSICSETFECYDDNHYYTPPQIYNEYENSIIELSFPNMFGGGTTVPVVLKITECGLAEPTLLLPINQAANVSTSPTLEWESVSGATEYQITVINTPNNIQTYTSSSNTLALAGLVSNSYYFWRVQAKKTGCDGSPSKDVFCFRTGTAPNSVLDIDINPIPSGIYNGEGGVESGSELGNNARVVFRTINYVDLLNGFEVPLGAVLQTEAP